MNRARIFCISSCLTILLLCFHFGAYAQEEKPADSGMENERPTPPVPLTNEEIADIPVEVIDTVGAPDPGKAAIYSAVLPGLGQAYNGSHWKIPLIYIGGAFVIFNVNYNNRQYSTSLRNLNLIIFNPAVTEVNNRNETWYSRATAHYRRNRDYTIILGSFLYGLNILDAYVDAHLQDFDINDNLAMRIKPALLATPGGQAGTGIALTLHFK